MAIGAVKSAGSQLIYQLYATGPSCLHRHFLDDESLYSTKIRYTAAPARLPTHLVQYVLCVTYLLDRAVCIARNTTPVMLEIAPRTTRHS